MRYMLTDDLWAGLEPMVRSAKWYKGGRKPAVPNRDFLEALLYLARTVSSSAATAMTFVLSPPRLRPRPGSRADRSGPIFYASAGLRRRVGGRGRSSSR